MANSNRSAYGVMSETSDRPTRGENDKNVDTLTDEATTAGNHELTVRERAALEWARLADPPLRLTLTADNTYEQYRAVPDYPDKEVGWALIMQALGTTSRESAHGVLAQIVAASTWAGEILEDSVNSIFQFVVSCKPRNELQARLLIQMAQMNMAVTEAAVCHGNAYVMRVSDSKKRHRVHGERMLGLSTTARALSSLARTFTEQTRLLIDLQGGGDKNVTTQNVSVSEGGQAIVGNVMQLEGQSASKASQHSPPALTHSLELPMPMVEEPGRTVVPRERKASKKK